MSIEQTGPPRPHCGITEELVIGVDYYSLCEFCGIHNCRRWGRAFFTTSDDWPGLSKEYAQDEAERCRNALHMDCSYGMDGRGRTRGPS